MQKKDILEDAINKYNSNPLFKLWVDRQKRPTIGASVHKVKDHKCGTRQEVGDDTSLEMLKTLTVVCQDLVPEHLSDAYMVYSVGDWQRSREFHVKVHLPTSVFLSLTDKLCKGADNPVAQFEDEMKIREVKDHREKAIRDVLKQVLHPENREDLTPPGKFRVATVKQLDYPLVCLYQSDHGITTSISIEQLPEALGLLEKFLKEEWKFTGFQVGLVLSPKSSSFFQVAAVANEGLFAERTKKDIKKVKARWNWKESDRKYR